MNCKLYLVSEIKRPFLNLKGRDTIYIYVLGKLREGGSYIRSDALLNDAGELEDSIYRELEHEKTL